MKQLFVSRVLRDVSDGVMVLNPDGTVAFLNPSGLRLLGIPEEFRNRKYAALMEASSSPDNDDFHQLILDSIYDKDRVHRKEVSYTQPGGTRLYLQVRTSFLYEDDGHSAPAGIIVQFTDVTERTMLQKKQKDFMAAFTAMVSILCGWIFLYAVWDASGRSIDSSTLTIVLEIAGLAAGFLLIRYTNLSIADIGLDGRSLKKSLPVNGTITVAGIFLLLAVKAAILRFWPGFFDPEMPFWDWRALTWAQWIYPVTAFAQEFISHGIIQESLDRLFVGKYREWISVAVSSLFFGAVHIHKGLAYMICAMLLSCILCLIYQKQRSVWGLTIPHFALGTVASFLNFV